MGVELKVNTEDVKRVLRESIDSARSVLDELDQAREELIRLSREAIRESGRAIVEVHRGDLESALRHMERCEDATMKLLSLASGYPQLLYTGLVNNAVSEYVEARLFISIVVEGRLPGYGELAGRGVPLVPYLQGLGDLVGEIKRLSLELVREGRYNDAWALLEVAEAVYLELQSLDYPDALLPGVRRKADVARRIVDDLKAMLVDLGKRDELARLLRENLEALGAGHH